MENWNDKELIDKINQYIKLSAQRKILADDRIDLLKQMVDLQKKEIDLLKQEIKQLKENGYSN